MQDESHKKKRQHKTRLSSMESNCRSGVVVDLSRHRKTPPAPQDFKMSAAYNDLSALAVDMARLRLQVQHAYERLIVICAAIDAEG